MPPATTTSCGRPESSFCQFLALGNSQQLRRLPPTVATLTILSVGIGANTATFSLVHGLLLRPLPYPDSERIVSLGQVPGRTARGSDAVERRPAAAVG